MSTGLPKLEWEILEDKTVKTDDMVTVNRTERARVPGGWLVRGYSATLSTVVETVEVYNRKSIGVGHGAGVGLGLTFVPDPGYTW